MKRLILILILALCGAAMAACMTDTDDVADVGKAAPAMGEARQELCSSTCGSMEGQEWRDCVDANCGGSSGGDGGGGGMGGGVGMGEACVPAAFQLIDWGCDPWLHLRWNTYGWGECHNGEFVARFNTDYTSQECSCETRCRYPTW